MSEDKEKDSPDEVEADIRATNAESEVVNETEVTPEELTNVTDETSEEDVVECPVQLPNPAIQLVPIETDPEALCEVSEPVEGEEEQDEMRRELHAAMVLLGDRAAGLSAVQLGFPKKAFVIRAPIPVDRIPINRMKLSEEDRRELVFFMNARVVPGPQGQIGQYPKVEEEACLSIPDRWFKVERPTRVTIEDDINGKQQYRGKIARVILHELDHTNGITLFQSGQEVQIEVAKTVKLKEEFEEELVEAAMKKFKKEAAEKVESEAGSGT